MTAHKFLYGMVVTTYREIMLKKIPGSKEYSFNRNKQIIDSYGNVVDLKKSSKGDILIELFGVKKEVSFEWLFLLTWYETGAIENLSEHLDKIKFYRAEYSGLAIRCGFIMGFLEPIWYKPGFRYIPCFPRYAISNKGEILDTFTNRIITERRIAVEYEHVYIYSPDKTGGRDTRVHRLLGLAWLSNTDFITKPIINHIDGVKKNNELSNLEWCSLSQNSKHALDTGLNNTPKQMKTRDVVTGEVVIYKSASEMSHILGITGVAANRFAHILPGYLFRKRYEIKLYEDDSPWYYENIEYTEGKPTKALFTITTVNKKTGETKKFLNVKQFFREHKVPHSCWNLEDGISKFKEMYSDVDVSYVRNAVTGPYTVIDIETNQVTVFDAMWKAGEYIGRSRTELQHDLCRGWKFIYSKKWVVVPGLQKFVLSDYKEKTSTVVKVEITNMNDGDIVIADSVRHAERLTGLRAKSIKKYLSTGEVFKGYSFRPLES